VGGTGADIMAGGLFEDGSLFEEDAGPLASERVPPSESIATTFAEDPYPGRYRVPVVPMRRSCGQFLLVP
jgi:hypothetical protein